jgi:hypothetical protein
MSSLPKCSDYLKSHGWEPVKSDAWPNETRWIDPLTKKECDFVVADVIQKTRDEASENASAV